MNKHLITPIILAGGSGTRLWPLSRKKLPKQFHALIDNKSMLQLTLLRLKDANFNKPIIICNSDHKFVVEDQISEIDIKCDILLEPCSKNTAPAITLASLLIKSEANLLILAADHMIDNKKIFVQQIKASISHVEQNNVVIFGIRPTTPNTQYGYIETGFEVGDGFQVVSFKEKPNLSLAKEYYKNKNYYWNSGIFFFKKSTLLSELKKFSPEILDICKKTHKSLSKDKNFINFEKEQFTKCPKKSIDYAIMEYTKNAIMVPLKTRWSDIGSWQSLMNESKKDKNGNVTKGNIVTVNSKNSLIFNLNKKIIATNDVKNLVIVETKDSLLISSSKERSSIKSLVKDVEKKYPEKVEVFPDENRPWGSFESILKETGFQVKKIIVKSGGQLSLQTHQYRSEHWVVVSGIAEVTKGNKKVILKKNESIYIKKGEMHSLKNNESEDLIIIEVQVGSYLEEDDIQRYDDIYGRK